MPKKKTTLLDEKVPTREKLKEIGALFFVLCAAFVFISLITYDPHDIAGVHYPVNEPPANKGGSIGAALAYSLFSTLGMGAYVLVFFTGFWAFMVFFRRRVSGLYVKLISAGVTVFAFSTLLSLQSLMTAATFGLEGTAPGPGGLYGQALQGILVTNIGMAGALLFVLLLSAVSVVLATDWMIYTGAIKVWNKLRDLLSRERRQKIKEDRRDKARVELARAIQSQPVPKPLPKAEKKAAIPVLEPAPPPPPIMPVAKVKPRLITHKAPKNMAPYEQPPLRLFDKKETKARGMNEEDIRQRMQLIEQTLSEYGIDVKVVNYEVGPSVTIYELELSAGTPINAVVARQDEISMKLAVPPVRVVGPIPGKNTVGVEVPNEFPDIVRMREFLSDDYEGMRKIPLPIALGKGNNGENVLGSLDEMPHMLIAGTTGSGKSVCLKSIVTTLVCGRSWEEMKLILIDPKMVELSAFEDIPHLWAPVVTDSKKASMVLDWLVREMDDRYKMLSKVGSRDIQSYNNLGSKKLKERLVEREIKESDWEKFPDHMPYIVVVIDELADLMMTARKEVEHSIIRISQKARAVGIHLVVATQRPSADVITGLIRSNMPSRIAFRVASSIESRIILGYKGSERLLGKGDMLYLLQGSFEPVRAQCTFISEEELRGVVKFLKSKGKPDYHHELLEIETVADLEGTAEDELFEQAVEVVLMEQRGSTSLLQRKLSIGYTRAARLVDEMEKYGIVGKHTGSSAREVLITMEQWESRKATNAG